MKLELREAITDQGAPNKANEDQYLVCDDLAVVFDGATGLGAHWITDASSDAKWFVDTLKTHLREQWRYHRLFRAALQQAVTLTTEAFDRERGSRRRLTPDEAPCAAMIAVVITGECVELYQAGDCIAFLDDNQSITRPFPTSPLQALDQASIEAMRPFLEQGLTAAEARNHILHRLRGNRQLANTANGYPILTTQVTCAQHVEHMQISPVRGDEIILASDGFSTLADYDSSWESRLFTTELKDLLYALRRIERIDNDLQLYPRLKIHDDATAIKLRFS